MRFHGVGKFGFCGCTLAFAQRGAPPRRLASAKHHIQPDERSLFAGGGEAIVYLACGCTLAFAQRGAPARRLASAKHPIQPGERSLFAGGGEAIVHLGANVGPGLVTH